MTEICCFKQKKKNTASQKKKSRISFEGQVFFQVNLQFKEFYDESAFVPSQQ